ncbi:MAG: 50S ribosomal protein L3 [Candidatus Woesearchaeota archaeon]
MPTKRSPHKGSMQFWPRKRASKPYARVRRYPANVKEAKLLGFAGYKVGMVQVVLLDNYPTSMTKGEEIVVPATIIECPPLRLAAIRFYRNKNGKLSVAEEVLVANDKDLARRLTIPKESYEKKLAQLESKLDEFTDIRAVVYTKPSLTGIGKKKPEVFEVALGGSLAEKLSYLKSKIGKDILVNEVFSDGQNLDVHAVTKGKGIQGPVRRFGVAIRSHKSEKTKRGPGSLADWCSQAHIMYRVAHAGQMGYQLRTEYNKLLLKIGNDNINLKSGFPHYGIVKNSYVIIKGSVAGSPKRLIRFNLPVRENKKMPEGAYEFRGIIQK